MKEQLVAWQQKFDQLSQRERLLMLAIALVVVVFVLQLLLIDPLIAERNKKSNTIAQLRSGLLQLDNSKQILQAELAAGVNRAKERQQEQLQQQLEKLDQRVQQSVVAMIPPKLMTEVLENILLQDNELTLLNMENLPVEPIVQRDNGQLGDAETAKPAVELKQPKASGLFKHSFVLTLRGSYPATVRYFEKLAALPWRFYWDGMHYEVSRYPNATIRLQVHTVSMSEDWIGV